MSVSWLQSLLRNISDLYKTYVIETVQVAGIQKSSLCQLFNPRGSFNSGSSIRFFPVNEK